MSIELKHVAKSFGKEKILHDLSFTVGTGEVVSFLGPNGAGKSTCMKIITGLLPADSGEVWICGRQARKHPLSVRQWMGYLPENNPLYPEMYVSEYLEYVAGLYSLPEKKEAVERIVEKIKLQTVRYKLIGTLSKGYRQRVGLAQALVHDPKVVILDEPFTGLDPNQLQEMYALIKEISRDKAILFSSHALQEVSELCERILILKQGMLVADASLEELTRESTLEETFKKLTYESNRR